MRASKFGASFFFVAALIVSAARSQELPVSTRGGSAELGAGPVLEVPLTRTLLQRTTCETRNRTGTADPFINVLQENADGTFKDVAHDNDSAGDKNARVTFLATASRHFTLVMRPSKPDTAGTVALYCDGRAVALNVRLGGGFRQFGSWRNGETLRTVVMPGGPRVHSLFLFDGNGAMIGRYRSGASESAFASSNLSAVRTAIVATLWPDVTAPVRLVRNDAALPGHDADGDGLGVELEAVFGTCAASTDIVAGWECSRAADLRDTDGDGLRDGDEMLGRLDAAPYQWLPRWGADPRHKDIFIEVDFGRASPGEIPRINCTADDGSTTQTPTFCAASARRMAAIYADSVDIYPGNKTASEALRLVHGQTMNNPDFRPGVTLHFDTGVDPPAGAPLSDVTLYGDWGGHSEVKEVRGDDGKFVRAQAGDVMNANMTPARRGLFHYALGDPGGGGAATGPLPYLNFPMYDEFGAAHEFGHTLGLMHYGPKGVGMPTQDDGSGEDFNCKPNYVSLMNYSYLAQNRNVFPPAFSDGYGRPALNDLSVAEQHYLSQPHALASARYLQLLRDVYGYRVNEDDGSVDWNRDGVFSPTPVRANAAFLANAPGGGCEGTRATRLRAPGSSVRTPTITRVGQHTILLFSNLNDQLVLDWADNLNACPNFGDHCSAVHNQALPQSWNHGILAVDAQPLVINSVTKLLVVYRTAAGLFETTMSDQFEWTTPVAVHTAATVADEFSLASANDKVWLIFKTDQDLAVLKRRDPGLLPWTGGTWSADAVVSPNAEGTLKLAAGTSPSLLYVTFRDGRSVLWAGLEANGRKLNIYEYSLSENYWNRTNYTTGKNSVGRSSLAFVPTSAASALPGRLHVLFMVPGANNQNVATQSTLGVLPSGSPVMQTAPHDNAWLYAFGGDLWFDPHSDTNVRAALVLNYKSGPFNSVWLRPKADGIVGHTQRDFNDWEAIAIGTCRSLAVGGAQVNCPKWPFTGRPDDPVVAAPADGAVVPVPPSPGEAAACRKRCANLFNVCTQNTPNTDATGRRACVSARDQCNTRCE